MPRRRAAGFSLVEALISLALLSVILVAVASLLVDKRINRDAQMKAVAQANARNCLAMLTQKLRSAGWDPSVAGIPIVGLDPIPGDDVSQIEVFADFDGDGLTDKDGEQVLIRHTGDRIEWRTSSTGTFEVLALNITNDADGDGTIEPMFTPIPSTDPSRIRVQVTAGSTGPSPASGNFIRYTVASDVLLRKAL
jgi:type II secretory pathway pseudopilin PulG